MKVKWIYWVMRFLGVRWVFFRVQYALKIKLGWFLRRAPMGTWEMIHVSGANGPCLESGRFFIEGVCADAYRIWVEKRNISDSIIAKADEVCGGRFTFYSKHVIDVGEYPDWHRNYFTGERALSEKHWSQLSDFGYGDIKNIWELNRFGFVYALVRAYGLTEDEKYAERFWVLVEHWVENNLPNCGVNWKCGQEVAFRVMALSWGFYGFRKTSSCTPERIRLFNKILYFSAKRIECNLSYAVSQENNHGISEAMGMLTAGIILMESKDGKRWQCLGKKLLEKQADTLIYEDGSFSQYSINYHRVMLDDLVWSARLLELNDDSFSKQTLQKISKASRWFYLLADREGGGAPCLGANDGSHVLPLTACGYRDYRPSILAAYYMVNKRRCYPSGKQDELLFWLFGEEALACEQVGATLENLVASEGGHYSLRTNESMAYMHTGSVRHRPHHADILHVDYWWRGCNMIKDPGTYSYNTPGAFSSGLSNTRFHNTLCVDQQDLMHKVSRFLWLPWVKGEVLSSGETNGVIWLEAKQDAYRRLDSSLSLVRTLVMFDNEYLLVVDRFSSDSEHDIALNWTLGDYEYERDENALSLKTQSGKFCVSVTSAQKLNYDLVRADENTGHGWCSPYYQYLEPALSFQIKGRSRESTIATLFGPDFVNVGVEKNEVVVNEDIRVNWNDNKINISRRRG